METGRRSAVEFFCRNSLHVKAVCCFHRGAPSMMFDEILNVTLSEEKVSTTRLHMGILNCSCVLILLIHTKHKYKKMKSWTDPISSFPLRRTHPLGRQNVRLIFGQLPIKAGWCNAPLSLPYFSRSNKHEYSHKESP